MFVAGLQCVAQCTLDSCWYRAEILDVRRNDDLMEMSIIFVDYGSSDYIVDASKSVQQFTFVKLCYTFHLSQRYCSWWVWSLGVSVCIIHGMRYSHPSPMYYADIVTRI